MVDEHLPILIVGLPRSGTTWVGQVFSTARNTCYLFEPDNEKLSPMAWLCKNELHRFPYLTAKDISIPYRQLWGTALGLNRWVWFFNNALGLLLRKRAFGVESGIGDKSGYVYLDSTMHKVSKRPIESYRVNDHPVMALLTRRLLLHKVEHTQRQRAIIKSVHAPLSMDWISNNFQINVVFVLRNPYSLYASYKRMRMPDGFRNLLFQEALQRDLLKYLPDQKWLFMTEKDEQIAFQIMFMYKIIACQLAIHSEWTVISHDRLCMAPQAGYNQSFDSLGLGWSRVTDEKIDSLNETGKGFAPKRVSSQQPIQWKQELSGFEQASIERWMDKFDLRQFFKQNVDLE